MEAESTAVGVVAAEAGAGVVEVVAAVVVGEARLLIGNKPRDMIIYGWSAVGQWKK
jgi:hypothetical protein